MPRRRMHRSIRSNNSRARQKQINPPAKSALCHMLLLLLSSLVSLSLSSLSSLPGLLFWVVRHLAGAAASFRLDGRIHSPKGSTVLVVCGRTRARHTSPVTSLSFQTQHILFIFIHIVTFLSSLLLLLLCLLLAAATTATTTTGQGNHVLQRRAGLGGHRHGRDGTRPPPVGQRRGGGARGFSLLL